MSPQRIWSMRRVAIALQEYLQQYKQTKKEQKKKKFGNTHKFLPNPFFFFKEGYTNIIQAIWQP